MKFVLCQQLEIFISCYTGTCIHVKTVISSVVVLCNGIIKGDEERLSFSATGT